MVLVVGVGTFSHFVDDIFHAFAAFLVARGCVERHGGEVVSAHVSVETVPVGIGLGFGGESRLFAERCHEPVAVVLQEGFDVEVASGFEWSAG